MPIWARLKTRPPKNIIGPEVRRLRYVAALSQPALAAKCHRIGWDIERDTIAKIERQSRNVSDVENGNPRALLPSFNRFAASTEGGTAGTRNCRRVIATTEGSWQNLCTCLSLIASRPARIFSTITR